MRNRLGFVLIVLGALNLYCAENSGDYKKLIEENQFKNSFNGWSGEGIIISSQKLSIGYGEKIEKATKKFSLGKRYADKNFLLTFELLPCSDWSKEEKDLFIAEVNGKRVYSYNKEYGTIVDLFAKTDGTGSLDVELIAETKENNSCMKVDNFKVLSKVPQIEKVPAPELLLTQKKLSPTKPKVVKKTPSKIVKVKKQEKLELFNLDKTEEKKELNDTNINITLKQLIKAVVERNSNINYEILKSKMAQSQMEFEEGILDSEFFARATYQDLDTPNNTEATLSKGYLASYKEKNEVMETGVKGVLKSGASWSTTVASSGKSSSLVEKYKDYDTEYDSTLEISINQPLMRGFGSDATMARYNLASFDKKIQEEKLKKKLMDVIGISIKTYWKLYGAVELYNSWGESLKIARATIDVLEKRAEVGDIAYAEVLEAKSGMMTREAKMLDMQGKLQEIKNELLTLLNVPIGKNKEITFKLTDTPTGEKQEKILSLEEYFEKAVNNWPEFAVAKMKLEKEKVSLENVKDNSRARLDLSTKVWTTTLSDRRRALDDVVDDEFLSWYVGLDFSVPFYGSKRSESAVNIANLKKRQIELEIETLNRGLYNNIATKIEQLKSSQKRINYYAQGFNLKKELLGYEKRKFELGESSIRNVLMIEEDMLDYKRKLINTVIDWKISQATLDKAIGTLFKKYYPIDKLEELQVEEYPLALTQSDFN